MHHMDGTIIQELAPLEISFILQMHKSGIRQPQNYVFKAQPGSSVIVYLQDTATNFNHEEF
jgi:hypothetical protein